MNIDECLKTCPIGVDMAEWVKKNWTTLSGPIEDLDKLSNILKKIRGVEEPHIHKWNHMGLNIWECYCGEHRIFFPSIDPDKPQTPEEWDLQQGKIFAD